MAVSIHARRRKPLRGCAIALGPIGTAIAASLRAVSGPLLILQCTIMLQRTKLGPFSSALPPQSVAGQM
jgi:hypothetical protein